MQRVNEYVRTHGLQYTLRHGCEKLSERYLRTYDRLWRSIAPVPEELERQRACPPWNGKVSILVPVYRTDPELLDALFRSISDQTYEQFEVIAYATGERAETDQVLQAWGNRDARFRIYHGEENLGISGNTNRAAAYAEGEYIALCDHDDLLSPEALWQVARRIAETGADVVYTDEDKITEDGRVHTDPHCKPDLCETNLLSSNYVCHFLAVKREVWEQAGGERSEYDGSQDHDLMLRLMEITDRVEHVPMILYHWRTVGSSMSHRNLERCTQLSRAAVQAHLDRTCGGEAWVDRDVVRFRFPVKDTVSVDVVILESRPGAGEACRERMEQDKWKQKTVRVVSTGGDRFAAMNRACQESRADVVLFLDASVQVGSRNLISDMLPLAMHEGTGFVTPCLTDERGRVTHAGFAVGGEAAAICRQEGVPRKSGGWHLLLRQVHEVSAVSAACMMICRERFRPFRKICSGGLESVDLCLRLQQAGLHHLYLPGESAVCTQRDLLLSGSRRPEEDLRAMRQAWPDLQDRCWNPCYDPGHADGRLAGAEVIRKVWRENTYAKQ